VVAVRFTQEVLLLWIANSLFTTEGKTQKDFTSRILQNRKSIKINITSKFIIEKIKIIVNYARDII